MAAPKIPPFRIDIQKLVTKLLGKLPKEIEEEVTVRIKFKFVTTHPVTGKDIEITPEVVTD